MRLRLTTSRSDRGLEQSEGDTIDVGAEEGRRLLEGGQAEIVREQHRETAAHVHPAVETAARRRK